MSTGQPSIASDDVSCAVVPFRYQGRLWITVVVKARFALVPEGVASYVGAGEILAGERRIDANPTSSVEAAGDLVPYLPHCDVTFVGHAYASGGRPAAAATARLGLSRDGRPVLDKAVHVFGDRGPGGPTPFERMPLVYERAFGGPGELNPVGTATPNLVHPADPRRPTGFAPISRLWPSRKRLLGNLDRRALEAKILEIPDALPWEYFQAAPPDQQIEHLRGDEWLVLDGLHPSLPRVQTRMPAVRGVARVLARATGGAPGERSVNMVCDTLAIDGHHQTFALVWRGRVDVPGGEAALSSLVVAAALEGPGREVDWARLWARAPAARSVDAVPMSPAAPGRDSAAVDSTMALGPAQASEAVAKMLAPFAVAAAGDVATKGRLEATPFTPPSTAPFEKTLFDPAAAKREEVGASTMALRPEQQAAVGQRAVAPFAIPSAGAPGAGAEIPGAPWSAVAAPSLASLAGDATLAFDGTTWPLLPVPPVAPPVPAPVPMPPPLMAPMPVTSPPILSPPVLSPPAILSPVVAPMPPETPAPAPRAAHPPAVAPVPRAAPAPPPPAPPPPARPPAPPAPPPPPPGSTEALVAKLRAAGAGTGDMEALARALKPPPPPPDDD